MPSVTSSSFPTTTTFEPSTQSRESGNAWRQAWSFEKKLPLPTSSTHPDFTHTNKGNTAASAGCEGYKKANPPDGNPP